MSGSREKIRFSYGYKGFFICLSDLFFLLLLFFFSLFFILYSLFFILYSLFFDQDLFPVQFWGIVFYIIKPV
ncbi:hypothetical protein EO95_15005 [Methanosarcina sp. 1.H.T.1A.1]|nr:hypothetical protein EO95_15005 [Methanosarcina sp. 1.H.T.1A.1]